MSCLEVLRRLAGRPSLKPEKGRILLLGLAWIRDGDQGRENIHPSAQESHFWELVPRKQSDRKTKLCTNTALREVVIIVQPRKSPSSCGGGAAKHPGCLNSTRW